MQSLPVLILGLSGSGKSSSVKHLNPEETFIVNCGNKPLPFRGGWKLYTERNKEINPNGNMITTTNYNTVSKILSKVSTEMPAIKNIIIDDSQILIIDQFMAGLSEEKKGNNVFKLYNQIAHDFYNLIKESTNLREDLFIFFLHHAEISDNGQIFPKSVGKLLNEKIGIASMFTVTLFAQKDSKEACFLTQNDGLTPAKSPEGMFKDLKIPNNLQLVRDSIKFYFEGENLNGTNN